MQTAQDEQLHYQLRCPGLPLAVYREVAAHLQQVEGVKVRLVPQQSQQFNYGDSQVGALSIQYPEEVKATHRQQVDGILAYYRDRYGAWELDNTLVAHSKA